MCNSSARWILEAIFFFRWWTQLSRKVNNLVQDVTARESLSWDLSFHHSDSKNTFYPVPTPSHVQAHLSLNNSLKIPEASSPEIWDAPRSTTERATNYKVFHHICLQSGIEGIFLLPYDSPLIVWEPRCAPHVSFKQFPCFFVGHDILASPHPDASPLVTFCKDYDKV